MVDLPLHSGADAKPLARQEKNMDNTTSLLYIFTDGQDILLYPQQKSNRSLLGRKKPGIRFLAKYGE
ncbi:MAG: hypothetical protein ACYC2W_11935 [Desulfurivibrionaceae bacterium]